jgi:8-oxo-dGTP diphosphatase/2-hydroxy-dATP diphosphatase
MKLSEYKQPSSLRQATICFLVRGDEVLIAMKKRGFGKGFWNGVGGKVDSEETVEQAAIRETREEIGVTVKNIKQRAVINFYFPSKPDWNQQVFVYLTSDWEGDPTESEEMRPEWYKKSELPFDEMWADDRHWLPRVLNGEEITGEFLFGDDNVILDFQIK